MKSLLAVTFALALAGTSAAQPAKPIIAGVDGTFAPHVMPKLGGGVEGFNVDLIEELNKQLNRKIELFVGQFSGLIPAMNSGKLDFIGAPVTITPERAQNLLMSEPYLNTFYTFIVPKGAQDIVTLEGLKGKTISVNRGSSYDQWARERAEQYGFKVESFGTTADATQAVLSGRAQAQLLGNTIGAHAIMRSGGQLKAATVKVDQGMLFAAAFRKDDVALRAEVEAALECLKMNGTMARIYEKWLGEKPEPGSPAVTVYPGFGAPGFAGYDPKPHTPACK